MQIEKIVETPLGEADTIKHSIFFFKPHLHHWVTQFILFIFFSFSGCCVVVVVGLGLGLGLG